MLDGKEEGGEKGVRSLISGGDSFSIHVSSRFIPYHVRLDGDLISSNMYRLAKASEDNRD